ncbi:hypothetical protein ACHAXR_010329 [Thalassiosira sp. AJA248-18]
MGSLNFAAMFVAFSAVVLGLVQKYFPPSEIIFANIICTCCLIFFAFVADPATFFETLFAIAPVLRYVLPRRMQAHIRKSIECLQEGERRVAALEQKQKGDSKGNSNGSDISFQMLLQEIVRKRMQWRWVVPSTIAGICVKIIQYEKPKVVGQMMDAVVKEGANMDTAFWPFLRQLVLFVIGDYIFASLREYYKHAAAHRYQAEVRTDMLANLLDQEQEFFHSDRHSAGFIHLMNRETSRMQKTVNESLPRFILGVVSTVGGIHTLLRVDYRLALVGLFLKSPAIAALQRLSRKDIVKYGKLYDASAGDASRIATSILTPEVIHLLQAHVAQRKLVNLYRAKQKEFINYLEVTHFRQTLLCMVQHGLRNVEDVLLLAMGLYSVLQGDMSPGAYLTFRSHLNLSDQGPRQLIGFWNDLCQIRLSAAVYFELLYRESKIPCSGSICDHRPSNINTNAGLELSLKNVCFAYHLNPSVKVLDEVDLHLKPGKIVALCGGSGGGKTSITRLIQRFYDPTQGNIELNGIDIRNLDVAWLRAQIRVVDQDPVLPDMTIFENIALGLNNADRGEEFVRKQVIEAAKLAEAHEFITNKCESGYDTPVRHIHRLSGGQRQRIAIARALVSRAPILVCDEITSSLDADTEKTVIGTLFNAMKGKTVLVIAHRLSTIRHADEIVFLEHGKVVERGTHEELLHFCIYKVAMLVISRL